MKCVYRRDSPLTLLAFCKTLHLNVWQSSQYVYDSITAQKFVQWPYLCAASVACRILAYSALFFSGMCRHSWSYSSLSRHIHAYWDIIKVRLSSSKKKIICFNDSSSKMMKNAYFILKAFFSRYLNIYFEFLGMQKKRLD